MANRRRTIRQGARLPPFPAVRGASVRRCAVTAPVPGRERAKRGKEEQRPLGLAEIRTGSIGRVLLPVPYDAGRCLNYPFLLRSLDRCVAVHCDVAGEAMPISREQSQVAGNPTDQPPENMLRICCMKSENPRRKYIFPWSGPPAFRPGFRRAGKRSPTGGADGGKEGPPVAGMGVAAARHGMLPEMGLADVTRWPAAAGDEHGGHTWPARDSPHRDRKLPRRNAPRTTRPPTCGQGACGPSSPR